MRRHARSLEDCLRDPGGLARLSAHAWRLVRLQQVFLSSTPLARQSRVVNLKSGRIIIHAGNSAVAAKLRQLGPRLVAILGSEAAEVTGIDIRVQPGEDNPPRRIPKTHAGIGGKQKRALTLMAESLPDDSPLRRSLQRLVDRARG